MSVDLKDSRARPALKYRRPVLLDRLPSSPVASPTAYAAAAALVVIYGLAFAVAWKGVLTNRRAQAAAQAAQAAKAAEAEKLALVLNEQNRSRPAPPPVLPPEPPKAAPEPVKNSAPPPPAQTTEPPKPPEPQRENRNPAPEPVLARNVNPPSPAPAVPAVPVEPPPPPPRVEPQKTSRGVEVLGALVDPGPGKAQVAKDIAGRTVTLTVPNKLRMLTPSPNPALNLANAPRVMTSMDGDFDVQVRVPGPIKPGSDPVKEAIMVSDGWSFNGAGLLVWKDAGNYLRLERTSRTKNGRNFYPGLLVEYCKGGKVVDGAFPDFPEAPVLLRIERRGSEFKCLASTDGGQQWQEIKKVGADFATRVEVGLTASGTSKKPFPAKFEEFALARPGELKK